ncbi:MAG: hypothetical protein EOO13_14795 [Chitinophagaceae bacterium]|nr:MAG: hypothetical protein EOO13_14795 [Chitinophagaceae bacterium]
MRSTFFCVLVLCSLASCKKDEGSPDGPKVNFIFKFDSTQVRLNGQGIPASVPAGHKGQSPRFNSMSAHYLELTGNALTLPGAGQVLYKAPEVTTGGANAIDFSRAKFAGNNQVFLSVPLDQLAAGTYNYLRVSLAYQNYNIWMRASVAAQTFTLDATVASFIGFNTYVSSYKIKDSTVTENANKLQGYWAFESSLAGVGGFVSKGQAPPGATTVPNPLFASSPIPPGSCLVTGQFASPLVITGTETSDINIIVSLSTNKSFEWIDADGNATYDPLAGDQVVDMGIRGMIPTKQ